MQRMHEYSDETEEMARALVAYARNRIASAQPLDNVVPEEDLDRRAGATVTDEGVGWEEALRLWAELAERHSASDGVLEHRLLVFPDENHWVLKPQHAKIWYQSVFAFLAHTVLGKPWEAPDLLR